MEGRGEKIHSKDRKFFFKAMIYDAGEHLQELRTLARQSHANEDKRQLVITIDYTKVPPAYGLDHINKVAGRNKVATTLWHKCCLLTD